MLRFYVFTVVATCVSVAPFRYCHNRENKSVICEQTCVTYFYHQCVVQALLILPKYMIAIHKSNQLQVRILANTYCVSTRNFINLKNRP